MTLSQLSRYRGFGKAMRRSGLLRSEYDTARKDANAGGESVREAEYKRGYANGLERAIEICEGR